MKLLVLPFVLFSSLASATELAFRVPGNEHARGVVRLDEPTSLTVENLGGDVRIVEIEGPNIVFEAENTNEFEAILHFGGAPANRKIWIEYPKTRIKSGFVRGSVVKTLAAGGHVDVQSSFSMSLTNTATVHLTLFVPRTMLQNLRVNVPDNDIEVLGHFTEVRRTPIRFVTLWTESGSITCEGMCARGQLRVESLAGQNVRVLKVIGPTRIMSEKAKIELHESIGSFEIENSSGRVMVRDLIGDLEIHADSGDVTSANTQGHLRVTTDSGDVEATGHRGGGVEIRSDTGDLKCRNPAATYEDLKTERGRRKRTRGIPRHGSRGAAPEILHACVEDLVRMVDDGSF